MKDDLSSLNTEELTLFNSKYPVIEGFSVNEEHAIIDESIVNHIKLTFSKVKSLVIEDHDVSGQTLDIEKYLQYRLNKKYYPRENHDMQFFNISEDVQGMTVGILIDTTIIIKDHEIQQIRNIVASIFKGLTFVPNIKLLVYTYTGDLWKKDNPQMNLIVNEIKNIDDCDKIVISRNTTKSVKSKSRYYTTNRYTQHNGEVGTAPTFFAIDYITKRLAKLQSDTEKTALIVLTEGRPSSVNHASNDRRKLIDELTAQKLTYRAVTKAQANKINTFAITLTDSQVAQDELNQMFKGHIVNGDIYGLKKELIKKIDEFIIEVNK